MKTVRFVLALVAVLVMLTPGCTPTFTPYRSAVLTDPVESRGIVWFAQQRNFEGVRDEVRIIACSTRGSQTGETCIFVPPGRVGDPAAWIDANRD